jgi:hypothetical protein
VEIMGRPFRQYLNGSRIYSCNTCRCHSADAEDVESKVGEVWTGAYCADSAGQDQHRFTPASPIVI